MPPLQTNAVGLTDDLLIEILAKLPLKCVYRFKCVSKSWNLLIADHYVAARLPLIVSGVFYETGHKTEPKYGCNSDGRFHEADLSYLPFYHNSSIIDCCNGLLLMYRGLPSVFHVCNPTTRRWAVLPKPKNKSQLSILAFDPYKSPYYKVVCFTGWRAQGGQLEVFSSEIGRWTQHSVNWGVDTSRLSATMHYFDGVLHLLALPQHVVSIDLERMSCTVIELPEEMKHDACLGNSGGFLHCAVNDAREYRIWVLKGAKWVLKSRFSVEMGVVSADVLDHQQLNFLAFHPKEEVVYIWVMGNLVSYDLCKKKFEVVFEMRTEKNKVQLIQIWLFPFTQNVSECLA